MKTSLMITIFVLHSILIAGPKDKITGINQLIETRDGKTSCWGIVIQLHRLTFEESIGEKELSITDVKYSRELKGMMTWSVDKSRKILVIKFKKGMGDFGTGDAVTIKIESSAFLGEQNETFIASIPTDPL
jgi:hypothetical protein